MLGEFTDECISFPRRRVRREWQSWLPLVDHSIHGDRLLSLGCSWFFERRNRQEDTHPDGCDRGGAREDAGQWGGIRPRTAECPGSEQRISMGPVAKPEQHPSRVKLFLHPRVMAGQGSSGQWQREILDGLVRN